MDADNRVKSTKMRRHSWTRHLVLVRSNQLGSCQSRADHMRFVRTVLNFCGMRWNLTQAGYWPNVTKTNWNSKKTIKLLYQKPDGRLLRSASYLGGRQNFQSTYPRNLFQALPPSVHNVTEPNLGYCVVLPDSQCTSCNPLCCSANERHIFVDERGCLTCLYDFQSWHREQLPSSLCVSGGLTTPPLRRPRRGTWRGSASRSCVTRRRREKSSRMTLKLWVCGLDWLDLWYLVIKALSPCLLVGY